MISIKQFYLIAGILMIVAFTANLWILMDGWATWGIASKIAFVFGTLGFELLLAVFFLGLWKTTPDMTLANKDLDNALKEFEMIKKPKLM